MPERSPWRGEPGGWTTEADLIDGQRIDAAEALGKTTAPGSMVLVVSDDAGVMVSCCEPVELGPVTARVEIFSAKIRVTPEARSESAWVSSDWRTVEARAYPIRACPRPVTVCSADTSAPFSASHLAISQAVPPGVS